MVLPNENKGFFDEVDSKVDINELEHSVLDYWDQANIFEKSLKANEGKESFTFYDGPPYATGKPHYGHILQSAIKDTVLRYKTMRGYYAHRRVGWDTHGLPVETLVEQEFGYKTKKDIEDQGIELFNRRCRETVFRYIDEFTSTLKRVGRWADYDNAYATLDRDYMETEWWVFKRFWDQNLVYKDYRSTPYCIRCETPLSNFEVSSNYKDTHDESVYVLLKLLGGEKWLLVWTTTPWTLPGNAAVALNPNLKYVTVSYEGKEVVVATERVKSVFGDVEMKEFDAEELVGMRYEPLFDVFGDSKTENFYSVVTSNHVTAEDGTGLVHIAPVFGQEDFEVGQREDIKPVQIVDTTGRYTFPESGEDRLSLSGRKIFEAQKDIVKDLEDREILYKKEHYKHSYPFCWRCDTPLIYYALDTWFVRISEIKDEMISNAEQINWTPEHVKQGRFGKGIESAPDWAVSRNRFWSVPMPVWQCDSCDEVLCVGSVEELKDLSGGVELEDLHRPYVDDISWSCQGCDGSMKRIPEVLDVWFDAGSMPYAQWHYPFENKSFVEDSFPADFIVEAIEQTRLWFYVLHVLATGLTRGDSDLGADGPAYKHAIGAGLIMAEDGRKLSKKLKNYPEPEPTLETYGADVMRLYLMSGATLGEPYRFSEKDLRQVQRNVYLTLWNVYSFFVRYANTHDWQPVQIIESDNLLDKWILARLTMLEKDVIMAADGYHIDRATREFIPFIDDLSNWYVRRSRNRFQRPENDMERDEAFSTLYSVLTRFSMILAPFMPFVSESMYRNLVNSDDSGDVSEESVHLQQLSDPEGVDSNQTTILEEMAKARHAVSEGLALRAETKLKVRQPLEELVIEGDEFGDELTEIVREEVNVKSVVFEKIEVGDDYVVSGEESKIKVALKTAISDELKREGLAREIIRHGQVLRREAGYALDDRITLVFKTENKELVDVLDQNREIIMDALQVDDVVGDGDVDALNNLEIDGASLRLGVRK